MSAFDLTLKCYLSVNAQAPVESSIVEPRSRGDGLCRTAVTLCRDHLERGRPQAYCVLHMPFLAPATKTLSWSSMPLMTGLPDMSRKNALLITFTLEPLLLAN